MKILEQLERTGRRMHLSKLTVECYSRWVREFLVFHGQRSGEWGHPSLLAGGEVEGFLNYLACERRLSASSQNQATNAIVFLYEQVLADELPEDHLGRFAA